MKAFLRGQIISYTIGFKKKHMAEINKLEREISHLEKEHQMSHSKEIYQSLVNKKLQCNLLNTYRIEKNILRTKQRYYEWGEKAQKVLAWQLKAEEASRAINSIETETGKLMTVLKTIIPHYTLRNPQMILAWLIHFYEFIWKVHVPWNIDLPRLTEEDKEEISSPPHTKRNRKSHLLLKF